MNAPLGTKEWLREQAEQEDGALKDMALELGDEFAAPHFGYVAGLRAAADRMESLERRIKMDEDWQEQMHAYRERAEEAEAKLARLRADQSTGFRLSAGN